MKYTRVEVFSLEAIIKQLVEWVREYKVLPEKIYLPPEEYVYINYLGNDLTKHFNTFCGIPLDVYVEEQALNFTY